MCSLPIKSTLRPIDKRKTHNDHFTHRDSRTIICCNLSADETRVPTSLLPSTPTGRLGPNARLFRANWFPCWHNLFLWQTRFHSILSDKLGTDHISP